MDIRIKQRVIGGVVVILLVAIWTPYLLDRMYARHKTTNNTAKQVQSEATHENPQPQPQPLSFNQPSEDPVQNNEAVQPQDSVQPTNANQQNNIEAVPSVPQVNNADQLVVIDEKAPSPIADNKSDNQTSKLSSESSITSSLSTTASIQPKAIKIALKDGMLVASTEEEVNSTKWGIKLLSLSSAANAKTLTRKLQQKGFVVYTQSSFSKNHNPVFTIIVGAESTRQDAQRLARRLRQVTQLKGKISSFDPTKMRMDENKNMPIAKKGNL